MDPEVRRWGTSLRWHVGRNIFIDRFALHKTMAAERFSFTTWRFVYGNSLWVFKLVYQMDGGRVETAARAGVEEDSFIVGSQLGAKE